jgi:hypothetical protein
MAAIRDILITGAISNWFAIVGLLTVWLYYRSQIRRGRIQAIDFWDRSGIRMFLLLTPNDRHACFTCHTASGTAILARDLARKKRGAGALPSCTNACGCRCQYIGLYGGWLEAQELYLRLLKKGAGVQLTKAELHALLQGEWQRFTRAADDRLAVYMLKAMVDGADNVESACSAYQYVIIQAEKRQGVTYVVPAYLYKTELLIQHRQRSEARAFVGTFWEAYNTGGLQGTQAPTAAQLAAMKEYQARLADPPTPSVGLPRVAPVVT